jgi:hypothetical protein
MDLRILGLKCCGIEPRSGVTEHSGFLKTGNFYEIFNENHTSLI